METKLPGAGVGLTLGKFMPPHRGHQLLVDFARAYAAELTVLACTLESEPIPGALRYQWMREMFPRVNLVHVTDEVPSYPEDHPDFWSIWRDLIRREVPGPIDYFFASDDYGHETAKVLGCEFVPVDLGRALVPVSATAIRNDPMANWSFIPECARPYYAKRVCVFGPESTGKSTLARDLARRFDTVHVAEYARGLLDPKGGRCDRDDIARIARGQAAAEDALARQANRVLICDTDLLTTTIWSDVLFGDCPDWIAESADQRQYDLYLLCDVDVPWVDDAQRFLPHQRQEFLARCVRELESRGRPYLKISGSWEQRFATAVRAVQGLLSS